MHGREDDLGLAGLLRNIVGHILLLEGQVEQIMITQDQVGQALDDLKADISTKFAGVISEIEALKGQTNPDLSPLMQKVTDSKSAFDSAVDAAAAAGQATATTATDANAGTAGSVTTDVPAGQVSVGTDLPPATSTDPADSGTGSAVATDSGAQPS